jgi:hypothetical protein
MLTTHLHVVPKLKMSGAIHPLPHIVPDVYCDFTLTFQVYHVNIFLCETAPACDLVY